MPRLPSPGEAARSFAVLLAVSSLAVAQPILAVFGDSPETFVFAGAEPVEIVAFGVLVLVLPAVVALALEVVAGLVHPPARQAVHVALVGLFAALWVAQVAHEVLSPSAPVATVVALVGGLGAAVLYVRFAAVRLSLAYLAVAPLAFLGLFLFASPTADLVVTGETETAGDLDADTPVVVLVLDELPLSTLLGPDGGIDAELYPNIAAFADTSTWYRNATTTQALTLRAVPAVLTGQDVGFEDRSPVSSSYPDSLFTLYGGSYTLHVSEAVSQICPPSLCEPTGPGGADGTVRSLLDDARAVLVDRVRGSAADSELLEQFEEAPGATALAADPSDPLAPAEARAEVSPERFETFLEGLEGLPDRSLSMIHLILPHGPFTYLPSGHTYEDAGPGSTGLVFEWPQGSEWPALLGRQRHVLQTQYTDGLLGDLVDELRATDLFDRAVVALAADHGATFAAGAPYRSPDEQNYAQVMWVPMMVKAPGQTEAAADDANVTTLDLLPTIAELTGVDVPFPLDGASAAREAPRESETKRFYRSSEPPYMPGPEAILEYPMDEGAARARSGRYPSAREGDPAWWPYQVGQRAALIGRRVDSMTVGPPSDAVVTLDDGQLEALAVVDPDEPGRPVFVSGGVDPASTGEVVVAVNGRVAAVSPVFATVFDDDRIAAMIPEMLLTDGANDVVFYALDATGDDATVLRPLRT